MVVSALTTSSPDSSSTRRSTPCVLGCCGPMLTVIVSDRSSGVVLVVIGVPGWRACALPQLAGGQEVHIRGRRLRRLTLHPSQLSLHQLADRVNQRAMCLLDPG